MARGYISPPLGRIEAREAHKNTHEYTTINRNAGGGMGGSITVKQMQQSAGIEVEKWGKIQQLFDTFVAAGMGKRTQQPTEYDENDNNERMRRAGGEG
eukprot:scaffold25161_cov42-Cyclotella_meneghiniana.AAC.2